ncbi:MAG: 4Fe-4S cluster-binding domain-containing protein, partial [Eubacteriaceae bacterium]|nr:4Fe-4S cluster-binding domain-containing protein [Eubacteriaceae bacterium]
MIHKYNLRGYYILLDINSGSVFEIDNITYRILDFYPNMDKQYTVKILESEYKIEDIEKAMSELDYLVSEGILFSDDIDFDDKLNVSEDIKAMCLHVSHDCNIRCEYCFAAQGNFHGESMLMDLETGKRAIDFLIENSGNRHNLEIDFFGGEPLMNLDVVKGLVDYARSKEKESSKHFRFTMTTNGVLLNDENMEYLNENMSNIVLSIDGRKEVNDRMRKTVNDQG